MAMKNGFKTAGVLAVGALLLGVSACSQGSTTKTPDAGGSQSSGPANIKIAYQQWGPGTVMKNFLTGAKAEYEAANPGSKVEIVPIVASENDYYTKLQLMMRSPNTAPDIVYEDTFLINSDITAGYLKPLDDYIKNWADWNQFEDTAKGAAKGQDGKTYGVPDGTDTRALWYNKQIFAKAGLPADWQPKTWDDVLTAARTIKQKVPGVIPLNVYSGKPMGEASAMQGFEMLLYGTKDTALQLRPEQVGRRQPGLQGLAELHQDRSSTRARAAAQAVPGPELGQQGRQRPAPRTASWRSRSTAPGSTATGRRPAPSRGRSGPRCSARPRCRPRTAAARARSACPAAGPGRSRPSRSRPDAAWNFIKTLQTQKNATKYATDGAQIAVRKDVAADDGYKSSAKSTQFFTDLVSVTVYRPALPEYPKVSNEIITAMEAVMTGQSSPDEAAKNYDEAVEEHRRQGQDDHRPVRQSLRRDSPCDDICSRRSRSVRPAAPGGTGRRAAPRS